MSEACWVIAFHSNTASLRSKRWYRVVRIAFVDGAWFELYWHQDPELRGKNEAELRKKARQGYGLDLRKGLFTTPVSFRLGNEMVQI
jgi:hypothetical protein